MISNLFLTFILGEGIGKKAAKNDAAEKMLILLKDLPPPEPKKNKKGMLEIISFYFFCLIC